MLLHVPNKQQIPLILHPFPTTDLVQQVVAFSPIRNGLTTAVFCLNSTKTIPILAANPLTAHLIPSILSTNFADSIDAAHIYSPFILGMATS